VVLIGAAAAGSVHLLVHGSTRMQSTPASA
jgi:hypothetical protein